MKNNSNRIIILVVFVTFLVFLAGLAGKGITVKTIFNTVLVRPVQKFAVITASVAESLSRNVSLFRSKLELDIENRKLKEENEALKGRLRLLLDNYYENIQLREQLEIKKRGLIDFVSAKVIGFDYVDKYLYIDQGSASGIRKNLPVVLALPDTSMALVGLVEEVAANSSRVMLSKNQFFTIGVRPAGKYEYEVAHGRGEYLVISSMLGESDVREGDFYLSSDISLIYPDSLLVGKVVKVEEKTSAEKEIYLEPCYDERSLFRLMVVLNNE